MSIWFSPVTLAEVNALCQGNMVSHLGIEFTEIGDDFLTAVMPVDGRTRQPAGLLHGGASAALAETVASFAANLVVDPARCYCVGLEISATHLRAMTSGQVVATTSPLHLGRTIQVWEIRIGSPSGRPVCISRLTLAVRERKKDPAST